MQPNVQRTIDALTQSLLLPIGVIAAVVFFLNQVAPEKAAPIMQRLVPLFVVVICVQGALTYSALGKAREQLDRLVREKQISSVISFDSSAAFHDYIAHRFAAAKEVRVTHMSSGVTELLTPDYLKIMDTFIRRGGIYHRMLCHTASVEVWEAQKTAIETYSNSEKQFLLHYLPNFSIERMQAVDLMLIDDAEVCFGGGYTMGLAPPVIAIRDPNIVRFFSNYYSYLLFKALPVRVDRYDGMALVENMLGRAKEAKESARATNGPEDIAPATKLEKPE